MFTDDDRNAARIQRQKQKHMTDAIWEIIIYFVFLGLVTTVAYSDRDERAYRMTDMSERLFDVEDSFSDINTYVL